MRESVKQDHNFIDWYEHHTYHLLPIIHTHPSFIPSPSLSNLGRPIKTPLPLFISHLPHSLLSFPFYVSPLPLPHPNSHLPIHNSREKKKIQSSHEERPKKRKTPPTNACMKSLYPISPSHPIPSSSVPEISQQCPQKNTSQP